MSSLVSFQLEHLRKILATKIALEGSVFGMDSSNMVIEMERRIEPSITVIARKTFTVVSARKMIPNVTFVCKFSLTNGALKALLSVKIDSFHNVLHVLKVVPPSLPDVMRAGDGQGGADLLEELLAGLHAPTDHVLWPRAGGLIILVIEADLLVLVKLQLATVDIEPQPHVLCSLAGDDEAAFVTPRGHAGLLFVSVWVLEADILQPLLPLLVLGVLGLSSPRVHCVHCPRTTH